MSILRRILAAAVAFESWCFDKRHGIDTRAGRDDRLGAWGDLSAGFWYLPTRPRTARRMLRDLPIANYSDYTFVDIGSGKGRMLFLAAEHPFRRIQGVELKTELHERAMLNLHRFKSDKFRCSRIECLNLNAVEYTFPNEPLIIYFFNPFGQDAMEKVLQRLAASIKQQPREVLLAMNYPEYSSVVDAMPQFQCCTRARNCTLYRSVGVV